MFLLPQWAHSVASVRETVISPQSAPELAGDAPVVHVLHPVEIGLGEALGHELDAPVLDDVDGLLRQRLHLHKPLRARQRLHHGAAAIAAAHVVAVGLHLHEIALLLQIGHDRLAGLVAVEPVVLAAVTDLRVLVDALHLLEIMAQADLVVVGVVAGRHLHRAGAEAELDVFVRHDRELAPHERQDRVLADEVPIALVVRVDGHAGVAQHGLGPGRGDDELLVGVLDRVADVPEVARHVLVLDLRVRQGGAAVRAPVDDAAALVDEALFVEIAEGLAHGLGADLVQREAVAVPVAGGAHLLLLLDDAVAVLVLPVPDALEELLAAQIVAAQAFLLAQLLLDAHLRGDARVILPGQPERRVALHPLVAGQDVLQRRVQRVAHVKLPRDVGGRHDDGEGFLLGVDLPLEEAAVHPEIVDLFLDLFRFVHLRKLSHGSHLLK